MKQCAISLQNRLALTYALFISFALIVLTVIVNIFTSITFTALVKNNIAEKSAEIVRAVTDQYKPMSRSFDALTIEAIGMYFVHDGYIVTVEDEDGGMVWDARSCNMQECSMVMSEIVRRMEGHFGMSGAMRKEQYPVWFSSRTSDSPRIVGTVTIETYGPFFYSETERIFLTSINHVLITATVILTIFTVVISIMLSRAIARPVNKSADAARQIAQAHAGGAHGNPLVIRIDDTYHTKELAELARSINELASELEEGERRQKRLSSDIAHELRTPLTCLQGDIEAMIDGVYTPNKEHLESCHEEIIRLAGLVQDLNTLTNLEWERITLNKTEFDLGNLLRITAEQFNAAALEKGITIQLDLIESPITADYDRLKQVFINLVSNAVKYTDEGNITIRVKRIEDRSCTPATNTEKTCCVNGTSSATWEVAIADTGIGIPENDLPHIFERFYRTDKSRNRSTGGAGIGLTIAAAIVAAHKGTMSVASNVLVESVRLTEGKTPCPTGTVFRVVL